MMLEKARKKLWLFAVRNHPEGYILTKRLMFIKWVLFPIDSLFWYLSEYRGYQAVNDTWVINGVCFSGRGLMAISEAQGETYKITRNGSLLTFEKIEGSENDS
jgi:hypothetical protein